MEQKMSPDGSPLLVVNERVHHEFHSSVIVGATHPCQSVHNQATCLCLVE